jgi:fatty-acyl-CoA synthase
MDDFMTRDCQMSYAHGASSTPLIGETIGDFFDHIASRVPHHEALVSCHQTIRYSYEQLKQQCDQLARALMASDVVKGDRVGIWSPNCAEWILVQLSTAKIGAILVNINPAYRTGEAEYALRQSGCSVLIIAPPFKTSNYAEMIQELCPELVLCEPGSLSATRLPSLRTVVTLGKQNLTGAITWEQLLQRSGSVSPQALAERQATLQFDDPINIQYTSGTTGSPKGATLSHHSLLNNGFFIGERMGLTTQDRLCIPVPFYHCFGMVCSNLACITHGATMVIPAPVFDPLKTLEAVANERCTGLQGVPTMFISELAVSDLDCFDLSSLRTGCMGGSPCPIEVMKQVTTRMNMKELTVIYGMTETSPVSFQSESATPIEKRVCTVGRVHPHVQCKIIDPATGAIVPRGVTGELLSRGYLVMLGYWANPEATAAAIDGAGWMHTGDLATMDNEGYVNIVGRSKDMVTRGGENIYPREIEEFLYSHPKIQDVQVIGVPDEKYGEEVMAWVKLKAGVEATPEELRQFCVGKIAHFKVPRYWRFTDHFPMTVTGKVQKFRMREIATEELGLVKAAQIRTA